MHTVNVNISKKVDNSYQIVIGQGILELAIEELANSKLAYSYALITDSNVKKLYGENLFEELKTVLPIVKLISFPAGEQYKTRKTKEEIENIMLDNKFGRDSAVIALGGGVVGDLAGFVAATYCRGIPHIQLPTTLVACVDSSVGGKTAVDTPYGKNLIGCFHQPRKVYADTSTLLTLEKKELVEGVAEVIKYGIICDPELFCFLETEVDAILNYNLDKIDYIVHKSCSIKAEIVEKDEKESNLRKILNFGHTVGHAIENASSYTLSHGQAISIGMIVEGKIALHLGLWKEEEFERLVSLIKKFNLPTKLRVRIDPQVLIEDMKLDKKSRQGIIEMVLPTSIGSMATESGSYGIAVEPELIKQAIVSIQPD